MGGEREPVQSHRGGHVPPPGQSDRRFPGRQKRNREEEGGEVSQRRGENPTAEDALKDAMAASRRRMV